MPRASQDYSDQDYQHIKRAAQNRDQDIRTWISTIAAEQARQQLKQDAEQTLKELAAAN